MSVVTEPMADVRSASVGFWVGTGSRDETAHLAGASHFLEHLLFKGTPTRSARDIAARVDALGGEMNAYTTKEYTAFYLRVLGRDAPEALAILHDIMSDPAFRPDEVEAERDVILEELLMQGDEPAELVHDLFLSALYPGHPLGREVMGHESTVKAMTREDIAGFFATHYRPGNLVLAAAGDIEHAAVVAAAEEAFEASPAPVALDRQPPQGPARSLVDTKGTEQAHLVVGLPALDRHDPDRYALAVVNHALGGGLSSRLFQEIREERGLAYSVYSYRVAFADCGAVAVYVGTAPNKAAEVVKLVHDAIDRLRSGGITSDELDVAKAHLLGSTALNLEDSAARMSRIGRSLLVHGDVWSNEHLEAVIAGVNADDVARVVDRVFRDAPSTLAAIGPFDDATIAALEGAA